MLCCLPCNSCSTEFELSHIKSLVTVIKRAWTDRVVSRVLLNLHLNCASNPTTRFNPTYSYIALSFLKDHIKHPLHYLQCLGLHLEFLVVLILQLYLQSFVVLHLALPFSLMLVLLLISPQSVHGIQVSELHVLRALVMSDQHLV